ncbi:MAG: FxsA family protein [Planctomycetota bacterium]
MLLPLFLLFTLMPLLELWLLFQLSGLFGFWTTIAVVLLTGMVGAWLAKLQGWQTMFRIQSQMRAGQMPAEAMGDGVMILIAGVLLITPGVLTDVFGLSLLLPPVRVAVKKFFLAWVKKNVRVETVAFSSSPGRPNSDPNVVEGRVVDAHVVENNLSD